MNGRRLIFFALVAAACTGSTEQPADVPTLELSEDARIGTVEGGPSAFTAVVGVLPLDSTILVIEANPPRLAAFDEDGRWLRDLSGLGDGPGELRRPSILGRTGEDIWVGDPMGGRLEVFTDQGSPLRSYRWHVPADTLGVLAFPSALLADGSILAGPGALSIGGGVSGHVRHRPHYKATGDGEVLTQLYLETLAPEDFVSASIPSGGAFVGLHPLRQSPIATVYPDGSGLVVVERLASDGSQEASFRLLVVESGGTTAVDRQIPYVPVAVGDWLERRLAEMELRMLSETGLVDRERLTALRESWGDRRYLPPVTAAVAGGDGSIWIRREQSAGDSVGWQVFSRQGEEIGRLVTPAALTILWASMERVWGVVRDELDVPYVVGFDVRQRDRP